MKLSIKHTFLNIEDAAKDEEVMPGLLGSASGSEGAGVCPADENVSNSYWQNSMHLRISCSASAITGPIVEGNPRINTASPDPTPRSLKDSS